MGSVPSSPSPQLYTLGRGILYFAEITSGVAGSYVDVGNCPRFEVEVTEETLDHFSSRTGLKTKDKTVTLETGYNVNFDLDEISVKNLAMFLRGTLNVAGGSKIYANMATDQEFAIRFVSDNPVGPNETWEFWRVKLAPGAAFNLISDEWSKLEFSGSGLMDTSGHPTSPLFTVTFQTTTTTTTTAP